MQQTTNYVWLSHERLKGPVIVCCNCFWFLKRTFSLKEMKNCMKMICAHLNEDKINKIIKTKHQRVHAAIKWQATQRSNASSVNKQWVSLTMQYEKRCFVRNEQTLHRERWWSADRKKASLLYDNDVNA